MRLVVLGQDVFPRRIRGSAQESDSKTFVVQEAQLHLQPDGFSGDIHWEGGLGGCDVGGAGAGDGGADAGGHGRHGAGVREQPAEEVLFIFPARERSRSVTTRCGETSVSRSVGNGT